MNSGAVFWASPLWMRRGEERIVWDGFSGVCILKRVSKEKTLDSIRTPMSTPI
jgi:hypothetical protein